jgi:hypothetical protein
MALSPLEWVIRKEDGDTEFVKTELSLGSELIYK